MDTKKQWPPRVEKFLRFCTKTPCFSCFQSGCDGDYDTGNRQRKEWIDQVTRMAEKLLQKPKVYRKSRAI